MNSLSSFLNPITILASVNPVTASSTITLHEVKEINYFWFKKPKDSYVYATLYSYK